MSVRTSGRQLSGMGYVNILIAVVVWCVGLFFTRNIVPLSGVADLLAWALAFLVQAALSAGQTNQRTIGWRNIKWPYVALMFIDVALNGLGLLIVTQTVQTPGDALLYVLRAVTTGVGAWQVAGALVTGALIAALPEQLVRDAV